jgi:hypothetical protein|tara:strand:+ start:195 stop:605 length:411 start_codon:yes stop_codon:yes gene_type:complete
MVFNFIKNLFGKKEEVDREAEAKNLKEQKRLGKVFYAAMSKAARANGVFNVLKDGTKSKDVKNINVYLINNERSILVSVKWGGKNIQIIQLDIDVTKGKITATKPYDKAPKEYTLRQENRALKDITELLKTWKLFK